MNDMITRRCY